MDPKLKNQEYFDQTDQKKSSSSKSRVSLTHYIALLWAALKRIVRCVSLASVLSSPMNCVAYYHLRC